ncbi:type II toxin-antitoxin system HicA family toxin [Crocosphaera sp.]|uniref:type II toxin-antitoxin system HicA family toxin n=1 Tax=Crocosphaera sp. TaxID=2729996 RepID=UPI0026302FBC|nr:type II toxin-antitoxin system HicA family toxin [Crocosphaera sp.]MDJ0580741.1 type II toxin-antitoxin system HicA family toxin [Crocosphaera sp.]
MFFSILRKQLSCRKVAVIISRLIIIELLLLVIGILALRQTYYTYQNYTFLASQRWDSNVLFPTVPLALSSALSSNNQKQIEQILNTNYHGIQGLIITDIEGNKIIDYSHDNFPNKSNWINKISVKNLNRYPHDLLLDPFSSSARRYYFSEEKEKIDNQKSIDSQFILARVYYIRNTTEKFSQELLQWIHNPFEENARFSIYNLTILLFIIGGIFIWSLTECFLMYRLLTIREKQQLFQRIKLEKELVKKEKEKRKIADKNQELLENKQIQLQKEITILQNNLKEKISQNYRLIEEREKEQKKLEKIEIQQTQKIRNLQAIIKEYEQEILILEVWQDKSQELEEIKQEKDNLLLQLEEQQNLEQESKKHIQSLRKKIEVLIIQNQENEEKINDLQELQLSNKNSIQQREETIQQEFKRQLNLVQKESQYAFEEAQNLEQEKEGLIAQNKTLRENLNSEVEKNKYLEFVLERYKKEDNKIINELQDTNDDYPSIPTSYLTNISSRKAIRAFQKLGFEKDRHNGDHFILKKRETNTITFPIPHPRQELNPLTLKNILIQTNTTLEDFLENL